MEQQRINVPRPLNHKVMQEMLAAYNPSLVHMGFIAWEEYMRESGVLIPVSDELAKLPDTGRADQPIMQITVRTSPVEFTLYDVWSCYKEPDACWFEVDKRMVN